MSAEMMGEATAQAPDLEAWPSSGSDVGDVRIAVPRRTVGW